MATVTKKKKKYSKKSKKNWRKHTDIKDVEDYLDDLRQEERTGGPVEDKPDSSLFFVDTAQKSENNEKSVPKKSRKRKILKQDELLLPDTRIKPVGSKKFKQNKNIKNNNSMESDSSSESEDDIPRNNNVVAASKPKKKNEPKTKFDLWANEDKQIGDEHYLRTTRKAKIKIPKTAKRKVTELPAVEVCDGGASYNPTYEEHQELLRKAHEKEAKKVKGVEKLNRKVQWLSKEDAANLPTWEEEMSQGLFDDEKEENENNSSGEEQNEDYVKAVQPGNRKTKQQKRKERLEREQQKEKEAEKDLKLHENQIYRIKSLKKEILMKEKKIEEKRQKKEKVKETELTKTKRLGRHAFEEPNLEIQLSSEITGNLRSLKPEGNLLKDRFKSLQKRNIVESRKPVVPHRKYALKEYEKRSYKQPCIKEI